jgi:hypothetical protein
MVVSRTAGDMFEQAISDRAIAAVAPTSGRRAKRPVRAAVGVMAGMVVIVGVTGVLDMMRFLSLP